MCCVGALRVVFCVVVFVFVGGPCSCVVCVRFSCMVDCDVVVDGGLCWCVYGSVVFVVGLCCVGLLCVDVI